MLVSRTLHGIGGICNLLYQHPGSDFFYFGNYLLILSISKKRILKLLKIVFVCSRYVLPESPRWLLAKGRVEELKKIIETAARWNKRSLPPNYDKLLIPPPEEESSGSFIDLFKREYLRTTLLLMVAWYCLVLQYMAITLHIGEMGGDIYLTTVCSTTFFLTSSLETNNSSAFYKAVRMTKLEAFKAKPFKSKV